MSKDGPSPKQASLRRAVSTGHYALFHLLIDDAVSNWGIAHQRSKLARTFEHGSMKKVCEDRIKLFYSTGQAAAGVPLKDIALLFSKLQDWRHTADYDNSYVWTNDEAAWLEKTGAAFDAWRTIRSQPESQDFLLQLFLPKLPR